MAAVFFSPSSPSVSVSFSSSFSSFSSGTTSQDQVRHQLEILTPISSNLGIKGTGLQDSSFACQQPGKQPSEVTESIWDAPFRYCIDKNENFCYVGILQGCTVYAQRPGSTFFKRFFSNSPIYSRDPIVLHWLRICRVNLMLQAVRRNCIGQLLS